MQKEQAVGKRFDQLCGGGISGQLDWFRVLVWLLVDLRLLPWHCDYQTRLGHKLVPG